MDMTRDDVERVFRLLLSSSLPDEPAPETIDLDSTLQEGLGLSSLDVTELEMHLEEEFPEMDRLPPSDRKAMETSGYPNPSLTGKNVVDFVCKALKIDDAFVAAAS